MKTKKNIQTKKEQLETILSNLKSVGGILNSAVISRDGLLVASDLTKNIDGDTFAAMSAAMEGAAETAVSELKQGELKQIIVDADEGKLITLSAGKKALLVVLTKPEINIGLVLLELGRASDKLSNLLGD